MAAKIKIDRSLYERLEEAAGRAGYATTDEFIQHVLEKAVTGAGVEEQSSDEQEVEKQLRGLGYIE